MITGIETGIVAIACAVVDRFIIRYKQLEFDSVGEFTVDVENQTLNFPCHFISQSASGVKGAVLQTVLVDNNEPRNIIIGKSLILNFLQLGSNHINVSIPIKSIKKGQWEFQAVLTHGDSRFNPLYRLFPLQTIIKKTFYIDEGVIQND